MSNNEKDDKETKATTFQCSKFHEKCKAFCCKNAPIEKEIYERNQHKSVRQVKKILEFIGIDRESNEKQTLVLPYTTDSYCTFLNEDLSCNIYDDRPHVCKKYGTESSKCLRCPYQDKDGRTRSRQERRKILRDAFKEAQSLIKLGS